MSYSPAEIARFTFLYSRSKIVLTVIPAFLTWVIHDYFVTLEDEIRYIWPQRWSLAKFLFLFVRYYTLFLLVFDVVQIHTFAIPGFVNDDLCVAIDPVTRLLGGISLWTVEIIMQLRIFALYGRSKKIAIFNGVLFLISIGAFLWIMALGAMRRRALIATAIRLPLPGCPAINGGFASWALWIPATGFELVLLCFVLYKTFHSMAVKMRLQSGVSLTQILISDNILYFFGVTVVLIFNNVMASGRTRIPWFSFGPFHASLGIMTTRLLLHLRKAAIKSELVTGAPSDYPSSNSIGLRNLSISVASPRFTTSTMSMTNTSGTGITAAQKPSKDGFSSLTRIDADGEYA